MLSNPATGKQVQVLRSIRHAPRNLVLRGSLTPQKAKPTSAGDVDDLCNLFQRKANVTPQGKKKASSARTPSARYAKKKVDEEADSAKENMGKVLKSAQKKGSKSTRFSDDTKKAAVSPVRRSRRLSHS